MTMLAEILPDAARALGMAAFIVFLTVMIPLAIFRP
jgi:ABC-type proline/glycine betaine transport system permease subunit